MKPAFAALTALCLTLTLSAQEIRTNYRSGDLTHISTCFEKGEHFDARVERVGFPDGSAVYQLYVEFREKTPFTAPKGTKMAATLPGGAVIRADQIGQDSATKTRLEDGLYLNRLRYALEPADMERMTRGVSSVEFATGWGPEDFRSYSFTGDSFAALLRRHCDAIGQAGASTVDLTAEAAGRVDQRNSIMTAASPLVVSGENLQYNVILSHLYYKNSANEDIDLAFRLGTEKSFHIVPDAPVTFILADGNELALPQTRDEVNFIYLYPSLSQLRALAYGSITALRIKTEDGTLSDTIPGNAFSEALNQQYQLLMSLSER